MTTCEEKPPQNPNNRRRDRKPKHTQRIRRRANRHHNHKRHPRPLLRRHPPSASPYPLLNTTATVSLIHYYIAILTVAIYIGAVGKKELVIEKRFSVEFLMAVAGLGALYLDYRSKPPLCCSSIASPNILRATYNSAPDAPSRKSARSSPKKHES